MKQNAVPLHKFCNTPDRLWLITSFSHIAMLTVRQYLVFTSFLLAVNFQQSSVSKPYSTALGLIDAFGLKLLDCGLEYERKVVKESGGVVAHEYTYTGEWLGDLSVRKQSVFKCLQT